MAYTIGEVAKMLDVSPQSLRSWERHGFVPKPKRTPTNHRRYGDEVVEAIKQFLSQKNRP